MVIYPVTYFSSPSAPTCPRCSVDVWTPWCCRRAGHGDGVGHDFDKKRRERVVSRILLLMARPGQTTGPLFRPVGEAVEMECMRAFREEWGSCVENGFKDFDKAKKEAHSLVH